MFLFLQQERSIFISFREPRISAECKLENVTACPGLPVMLDSGVRQGISLLKAEVSRNMALLGVNRVEELDASHLVPNPGSSR